MGIRGSRIYEVNFDCLDPGRPSARCAGRRLQDRDGGARSRPRRRRRDGDRPRARGARRRDGVGKGADVVLARDRRLSGHPVDAGRHGDYARSGAAPHVQGRVGSREGRAASRSRRRWPSSTRPRPPARSRISRCRSTAATGIRRRCRSSASCATRASCVSSRARRKSSATSSPATCWPRQVGSATGRAQVRRPRRQGPAHFADPGPDCGAVLVEPRRTTARPRSCVENRAGCSGTRRSCPFQRERTEELAGLRMLRIDRLADMHDPGGRHTGRGQRRHDLVGGAPRSTRPRRPRAARARAPRASCPSQSAGSATSSGRPMTFANCSNSFALSTATTTWPSPVRNAPNGAESACRLPTRSGTLPVAR